MYFPSSESERPSKENRNDKKRRPLPPLWPARLHEGFQSVWYFRQPTEGIYVKAHLRVLTLSPPLSIMETCCVVLAFEFVNETLCCDRSMESCSTVLLHGTICCSVFYNMNFWDFSWILIFGNSFNAQFEPLVKAIKFQPRVRSLLIIAILKLASLLNLSRKKSIKISGHLGPFVVAVLLRKAERVTKM